MSRTKDRRTARPDTEAEAEDFPATIPMPVEKPQIAVFDVLDVYGEPHQLTVKVWPDNRWTSTLKSLVAHDRACRALSADEVEALARRARPAGPADRGSRPGWSRG